MTRLGSGSLRSSTSLRRVSAEWLARLPKGQREAFLESLTPDEKEALLYRWEFWARSNQLPPDGEWRFWLLLAGRGFGKSRTGAEWVRRMAWEMPGSRGALVGRTAGDVRDVMVDGESGILAISPRWFRPVYEPSKRRLRWPNGSIATTYSADEPDQLRGPQHHWAWCDELAAWRHPEAFDQLKFGLRLGRSPRCVITTTPRPVAHIRALLQDPSCRVTRGSTYDNRANLPEAFLAEILARYKGTRLGRQEINAEVLDDNPGALWQRATLDGSRVSHAPELMRVVVGVDPAASSGEDAAETGIVVAGVAMVGGVTHGYVLDDRSVRGTPAAWAKQAVATYHAFRANLIVAEANQGGEMVRHTIRTEDRSVPVELVHASRGKQARAEPVSSLYEQGKVHHVGIFPTLEDQMCEWVPGEGESPDRVDALVWALTKLMVAGRDRTLRTW